MAAGEYVSVSSQADTEQADLARERGELRRSQPARRTSSPAIYQQRGLEPTLARTVARQLMAHDALGAHARDELGMSTALTARPLQAAVASAATFAVGAALPLVTVLVAPLSLLAIIVSRCRWRVWRRSARWPHGPAAHPAHRRRPRRLLGRAGDGCNRRRRPPRRRGGLMATAGNSVINTDVSARRSRCCEPTG